MPILSAAASLMLVGLGIGHAQEQQQQPAGTSPRVQLRPAKGQPASPRLGKAGRRRGKQPAKGGPAAPTEEGGTSQGITEFETGIDFEPTSPRSLVTFNLEEADLPDLVRLISNITGKRFILPGKVRSIKATVYAPTQVRVSEAYNAFLSILEVNGMTIVPAGRYLKIVETSNIENQPIRINTQDRRTAAVDRFETRLHRVENVSAEDVATLLARFKSPEGNVTAYAPTNTVIITDTGTQIRRMLRLVEAVDIPRTGEQIWIEAIHYANATEIAARLTEIFPVGGGAPATATPAKRAAPPRPAKRGSKNQSPRAAAGPTTIGARGVSSITNILPDERTNSLIILASESAYLRILEMIRQLDIPLEGEGRIHVHNIQYGDAEDIASTLSNLVGGGGSGARQAKKGGAAARKRGGNAATSAGGSTASLFEGQVQVTSHEPTNSLVITSSLHDYAALRRVIERLDAPRRQVFIEAVIMELGVSRSSDLGFSFHGGIPDLPVDGSLSILGFNAGTSLQTVSQESLTGLALGVRGPNIPDSQQLIGLSIPGFGVVINALATSGDANLLSTPHIIAMDNVEAEISVGENIPLQTSGLALGGAGGLGGLAGLAGLGGADGAGLGQLGALAGAGGAGGVPRQDVGTTIRLTPHINDSDEIRLEIEEEISERGTTEGTLGVVSISRRTAKTEVMVRDQQTVVIGGLMRDSVANSETKIPILGDIPLIGALFRRTERTTQKVNLLLFLTPYIIRDPSDLRSIFERKMRERQEFIDRYFVFGDSDYEPAVDYSRTRGLVAEINNELDELALEHELMIAAQAVPPPEHVVRPPVGAIPPSARAPGDVVIEPESGSPAPANQSPNSAVQAVSPIPVRLRPAAE